MYVPGSRSKTYSGLGYPPLDFGADISPSPEIMSMDPSVKVIEVGTSEKAWAEAAMTAIIIDFIFNYS